MIKSMFYITVLMSSIVLNVAPIRSGCSKHLFIVYSAIMLCILYL